MTSTKYDFISKTAGNATVPSPIGGSPLGNTGGEQNHANCGQVVVIVTAIFTIVTTIIVVLRIISRVFILRRPGADDLLIVAATAVTIANVICIDIGVKYGTGRHESTISISDNEISIKYRLVAHLLYTLGTVLVKCSLLILYLRLFPHLRWQFIITIILIIAMGVAFILAACFRCNPIGAVWNPWNYEINSFTCFPALPFWISFGSLFLASDIVVLILPMRTILGLHISWRKKAVVVFLLSLGAFACVAGIVRLVYVIKLYTAEDASWNTAFVSISSTIEICCAVMAASLPSTRVFVDRLFPNLFRSTIQATSHTNRAYWSQQRVTGATYGSNRQYQVHIPMAGLLDKPESRHTITREFEIEIAISPGTSLENGRSESTIYANSDYSRHSRRL